MLVLFSSCVLKFHDNFEISKLFYFDEKKKLQFKNTIHNIQFYY